MVQGGTKKINIENSHCVFVAVSHMHDQKNYFTVKTHTNREIYCIDDTVQSFRLCFMAQNERNNFSKTYEKVSSIKDTICSPH